MLAQATVESGWGQSGLAQAPNNNLFGIKGSYKGQSVNMNTGEYGNGGYYTTNAGFRKYPSYTESFEDNGALLRNQMGNYYSGTWVENASNYAQTTQNGLQGKYATDPNYARTLNSVIASNHFDKYDPVTQVVNENRTVAQTTPIMSAPVDPSVGTQVGTARPGQNVNVTKYITYNNGVKRAYIGTGWINALAFSPISTNTNKTTNNQQNTNKQVVKKNTVAQAPVAPVKKAPVQTTTLNVKTEAKKAPVNTLTASLATTSVKKQDVKKVAKKTAPVKTETVKKENTVVKTTVKPEVKATQAKSTNAIKKVETPAVKTVKAAEKKVTPTVKAKAAVANKDNVKNINTKKVEAPVVKQKVVEAKEVKKAPLTTTAKAVVKPLATKPLATPVKSYQNVAVTSMKNKKYNTQWISTNTAPKVSSTVLVKVTQSVEVLSAPGGQKLNQKVEAGTEFVVITSKYYNGNLYYEISNGKWIMAKYTTQEAQVIAKSGVLTVNSKPNYGVPVWRVPGQNQIAGKFLADGSSWRYFRVATVQGQTWYDLGGNQWVSAKSVLVR